MGGPQLRPPDRESTGGKPLRGTLLKSIKNNYLFVFEIMVSRGHATASRLDSPGTLHHVMIRGIEVRNIFLGEEDREEFLSRVREGSLETGTRVLAWDS